MVRAEIEALRDAEQGIQDNSTPLDRMLERKKVGASSFLRRIESVEVPLESMQTMSLGETGDH